jgi:fatty-acyl-CoA synthase
VLKKVVIGGAACPETIIRAFQEDYDVEVVHAWGMTETSPVGTLSVMTDELEKLPYDEQMPYYRLKQGRPPLGVELKLTDDEGRACRTTARRFGHLKIKGPIIAAEYFRGAGGKILDEDGFFDTGDVATIDATASCRSPTGPRTSSSPAASGSAPSTSRTSPSAIPRWLWRR